MIRPSAVGTIARKVTHVLGRTLRQVGFIPPAYARQGPAPKMRQNRFDGSEGADADNKFVQLSLGARRWMPSTLLTVADEVIE